jgi:thioredoxin-dependent peroxiredoxin
VEGQVLRDRAARFTELDCIVLGASFDTVEDNRAFAEAQQFPFALLSDVDRRVGASYGVVRRPGHRYGDFPERYSFLIDPAGLIRRSYDVSDVAGHADEVLADLAELQGVDG